MRGDVGGEAGEGSGGGGGGWRKGGEGGKVFFKCTHHPTPFDLPLIRDYSK